MLREKGSSAEYLKSPRLFTTDALEWNSSVRDKKFSPSLIDREMTLLWRDFSPMVY